MKELTEEQIYKAIEVELGKGWGGQIKGFPREVVSLMLTRQHEAGNEIDVSIFENDRLSGTYNGGFDWKNTPEGSIRWSDIIEYCNFEYILTSPIKIIDDLVDIKLNDNLNQIVLT